MRGTLEVDVLRREVHYCADTGVFTKLKSAGGRRSEVYLQAKRVLHKGGTL